jgi:Collagen triple helix repeat (20 copies)
MPRRGFGPLLALLLLLVVAPQASAQAVRTWVSGTGDDVNPCSRTAPCKTFQGTISKTAERGEINAIDPGGFGTLNITKAITIDVSSVEGGVLDSDGVNGITINADATDDVVLRGLDIFGYGFSGTCTTSDGIRVLSARTVRIENTRIRQQARAVWIAPSVDVSVLLDDVTLANNCTAGVMAKPTADGSARVSINDASISNSGTALSVDDRAAAWLSRSTIFGNAQGLEALGTGTIADWGDNHVGGNVVDGEATTSLAPVPPTGPAGSDGSAGADGTNGTNGTNGADGADGTDGADGIHGATGTSGADALQVALVSSRLKAKAGRRVDVRFLSNVAGKATVTVRRAGQIVAQRTRRVAPGGNAIAWSGRSDAGKTRAGRYSVELTTFAGAQRTTSFATLRLR